MAYPKELKESVTARLLSGELTVLQASEEYSISRATLHAWKKKAELDKTKEEAGLAACRPSCSDKLKLPKHISYLDAYGAVYLMKFLSKDNFAEYCSEKNITVKEVQAWKSWFNVHDEAVCVDDLSAAKLYAKELESKLNDAVSELQSINKEIAKTKIMIELSKKAAAILGKKEN